MIIKVAAHIQALAHAVLVIVIAASLSVLANVTAWYLALIAVETLGGTLGDAVLWAGAAKPTIYFLNMALGYLPEVAPVIMAIREYRSDLPAFSVIIFSFAVRMNTELHQTGHAIGPTAGRRLNDFRFQTWIIDITDSRILQAVSVKGFRMVRVERQIQLQSTR